jgi:hypothetical protein
MSVKIEARVRVNPKSTCVKEKKKIPRIKNR